MVDRPNAHAASELDFEAEDEAVRRAMQAAVVSHAQAGRAVAGWHDGHVVWIEPEEILRQFPVRPAVVKQ